MLWPGSNFRCSEFRGSKYQESEGPGLRNPIADFGFRPCGILQRRMNPPLSVSPFHARIPLGKDCGFKGKGSGPLNFGFWIAECGFKGKGIKAEGARRTAHG